MKETNYEDRKITNSKLWFIPLVLLLTIVPLICIIHRYDTGMDAYPWHSTSDLEYDTYCFYRAVAVQIVGGSILLILAYLLPYKDRSFLKDHRSYPPVIAMGAFAIFSLLSSILSKYTSDAFRGGMMLFEGCFVLISYTLFFFFAFGYARTEKLIRFLLDALLIGAFIMSLLGTLQTFGLDWQGSDLFKPLLTLETGKPDALHINLTFDGQYRGYGTLFNPNYTGTYVALLFPYTLFIIILGKRLWRRILAGATSVMLLIMLYSSKSFAGIIGMGAAFIIAVIIIIPFLDKIKKIIVISTTAVAVIIAGIFIYSAGYIDKFFPDSDNDLVMNIDQIRTRKNSIDVELKDGRTIILELSEDALADPQWFMNNTAKDILRFTYKSGDPVAVEYDDNGESVSLGDEWPKDVSFDLIAMEVSDLELPDAYYNMTGLIHIKDGDHEWEFVHTDGKMLYVNSFNRLDKIKEIEKFGFDKHPSFASSRGYIWSRTFPLLKYNMLYGSGPDSFIYEFPNDDYVAREYLDFDTNLINKPHNMFLQIWMQEGFIALAAFIFLYILFIVRSFRHVIKYKRLKELLAETNKEISKDSGGISDSLPIDNFFLGVVVTTTIAATGFMVTGLANDSTIGVTPIYWTMLGVGYAAEAVAYKLYHEGGGGKIKAKKLKTLKTR